MSIHAPVGVIAWTGVAEESGQQQGQRQQRKQAEPGGTSEQGGLLIYDFVFRSDAYMFKQNFIRMDHFHYSSL